MAVNTDGRREVLGMATGSSEAETFWTDFLRSLTRRGLRGVKLVISDAHVGLKAAASRVLGAAAQRCRVHFMRNVLAHAGKGHRRLVSAWIATAFAEADPNAARKQWRSVADQLRPRVPRLAALMDTAEDDVLAFMSYPRSIGQDPQQPRRGGFGGQRPPSRPVGTTQRRDQAAHGSCRHLPQRSSHCAPGRGHPAGAERRVGRPAPLHEP